MATETNWAERRYDDLVETIADRLRRVADEIQREAGRNGRASAVDAAAAGVHTLHWGVANLHIDSLISAARDVDEEKHSEQAGAR